jgi:alginate O-acetyltransferase complex protein AlgI
MFPQLVAGPIVRFQDVADQLASARTRWRSSPAAWPSSRWAGQEDPAGQPLRQGGRHGVRRRRAHALDAWYGVVAYAFQIYFDFSAYSDMAIGLGLMLGFMFAKNFDSPYLSQSITEFWRRWHLSLSTWLRDNLYIPLGGNRKGEVRTYVNLAMTVMLLGGLWHGASWNFVIWGGIHGGMLAIERMQGKDSLPARRNPHRGCAH